ncbi:MAG: mechanosensitive ion channel [Flavobacteriaceae bacterium]|nr:mechanosensitive ion channel [Flavobacteriaceae bacterium]
MEKLTELKDLAIENFSTTGLSLLKALLVLLFGWLFIKLIVSILKRMFKVIKVDKLGEKLNDIEIVDGKKLNINVSKILLTFIKWSLLIVLFIIVSEMMGLSIVSEQIGKLIAFLPQLLSAAAIFVIGLLIANFVKKSIQSFFKSFDLSGSKIVSQLVFFIILALVSITALNQAGINTEIITNNLNMIFAAFLVSFALAVGIGAKEVVADLMRAFYTRRLYEIGQKIKFKGIEGEIEAIEDISIVLKTKEGKLIIPIKDIVENQVEIQV